MTAERTRREFTDEFKREAVVLLRDSGRPLTQVASRNVSTTLIQPGLEFRLGWSGRLCGVELSEAAGSLV